MKKTFQITLKDGNQIILDAVEKTTNETSIRVHEFFEQETPCLMLIIEHEELNTLLDLTKTSPYTLLYFHYRNIYEAAAYSNNELESPFFINTQFKRVLFVPSSVKIVTSLMDKYCTMKTLIEKPQNQPLKYQDFKKGYGKFPYIILKTGYAIYMQIPIHFNTNGDYINFPGTNLNDISNELLSEYENDKTSELHDRIISHCKWLKAKIESEKNREARICLVEGPEIGYYFESEEITFTNSIPYGGTLVTQQNDVLAMNANHYL
jgi:hypothetical protein